jgi:hypothetical protein
MSWIYPGIRVLAGLIVPHRWARVKTNATDDERRLVLEARKQRKRMREKLWNLRNPGRRRSYDKNELARVKQWGKDNPEKVKAAQLKYAQSDRGREMNRIRVERYRQRKREKAEKLSTEKARNPLTD